MSTLKNILAKKKSGEIKTKEVEYHISESTGEKIEIRKQPASVFLDIVSRYDMGDDGTNVQNMIPMLNELIYTFCPMFKENSETIKEAKEIYGVAEPSDLPEHIFEGNIEEMTAIMDKISSFYEVEKISSDIKN